MHTKPFARISAYKKTPDPKTGKEYNVTRLLFNVGASKMFNLVAGERVDLFWDKHNELWQRPVLIVRRGGKQRTMSADKRNGKSFGSFFLCMGMLVKQYSIPLIRHPLSILDYIDNEIWVDFGEEMAEGTRNDKFWKSKYGIPARLAFDLSKYLNFGIRANDKFVEYFKKMAESEGTTRGGLVLELLAERMQDKHPRMWDELVEALKNG